MSKAFTRESDDSSADEIRPVRTQPSPGSKNYITRQGADRLRQQIEDLLEKRRVLLKDDGQGDTSASLRRIDSDVQKLQRTLNSVIVAEPPA